MKKIILRVIATLAFMVSALEGLPVESGAACTDPASGKVVPFDVVAGGSYGAVVSRQRVLVRETPRWKDLWEEIHSGSFPIPPLPGIDFRKKCVAGIFMGEKESGGYSIAVEAIREFPDRVVVFVKETAPQPGAMVTMALTRPWQAVRLARTSKPVFFKTLAPTR